jgi:glucose-1-phosphate adenylyltransferase
MGIYVFETKFLFDQLRRDAADANSDRDFGKDIIPHLVEHGKVFAHRFTKSCIRSVAGGEAYWRDVGTVDSYWEANLDLATIEPGLNLYDRDWPIWTYAEITPPAKFIHDQDGRRGSAISSLVAGGCICSGSRIDRSLLFTGVHAHSYSRVKQSVVLPYVNINRGARIKNAVIDRGVDIPRGLIVGEDREEDARRFRVTDKGVVLITQKMIDQLEN